MYINEQLSNPTLRCLHSLSHTAWLTYVDLGSQRWTSGFNSSPVLCFDLFELFCPALPAVPMDCPGPGSWELPFISMCHRDPDHWACNAHIHCMTAGRHLFIHNSDTSSNNTCRHYWTPSRCPLLYLCAITVPYFDPINLAQRHWMLKCLIQSHIINWSEAGLRLAYRNPASGSSVFSSTS